MEVVVSHSFPSWVYFTFVKIYEDRECQSDWTSNLVQCFSGLKTRPTALSISIHPSSHAPTPPEWTSLVNHRTDPDISEIAFQRNTCNLYGADKASIKTLVNRCSWSYFSSIDNRVEKGFQLTEVARIIWIDMCSYTQVHNFHWLINLTHHLRLYSSYIASPLNSSFTPNE